MKILQHSLNLSQSYEHRIETTQKMTKNDLTPFLPPLINKNMNSMRIYHIWFFILISWTTVLSAKTMKINNYFETPLQRKLAEASAKGLIEDVRKFLNEGAKVNYQGNEGMTALIWTLLQQNKKGYQYLLENGADPNLQMAKSTLTSDGLTDGNSAVSLATMHEDPWYLMITLKHGGNPNIFNSVKGVTPIFQCIKFFEKKHPRLEQLKLLIAAGADLNALDKYGFTPIMQAVMFNRFDMVYLMLESGADPTIKMKSGVSVATMIKDARIAPENELYQWRTKVINLLKTKEIDVEGAVSLRPNREQSQRP